MKKRMPLARLSSLLLIPMAACVTPPQTTGEFRAGVQRGAALTTQQTHETNREFSRVVADIERNAGKCLAVSITSRVSQGANVSQGTSSYFPRTSMLTPGKAEFTLQATYRPQPLGGAMPAGGYFVLLVDIEKVAPQRTRASIYGGSIGPWKGVFVAIKEWVDGKDAPCPELP